MLKPPVEDYDTALWRAILEAAAGFNPITDAIARIFQVTAPSEFSLQLAKYRSQVARAVNDHEARLVALEAPRPRLNLSAGATALAMWLAKQSPSGLEEPVGNDEIKAAFPDATDRELEDAAAELEMYGLALVHRSVNQPVARITPNYAMFALFDPLVRQTSPQNDAVAVAGASLELDSGDAAELEQHLGWERRRFNPAFALVLTLVVEGRIRQSYEPRYPRLGFALDAQERVRFRQLIAEAQG